MLYRYTGVNRKNQHKRGFIQGENRDDALLNLKNETDVIIVTNWKETVDNKSLNDVRTKVDEAISKVDDLISVQSTKAASKKMEKSAQAVEKKRQAIYSPSSNRTKIFQGVQNTVKNLQSKNLNMRLDLKAKRSAAIDEEVIIDKQAYYELLSMFKKREEEFGDFGQLTKTPARQKKEKESAIDWSLIDAENEDAPLVDTMVLFKVKVKPKTIILMTRRLQIMLSSGVSLVNGLMILSDDEDEGLSRMLKKIVEDIQTGFTFSEAISHFPEQFDNLYVSLVSIGEASGSLTSALNDLVYMMEQKSTTEKKVKSASIYPSIIGGVLGAVMILGSIFFIPMFEEILVSMGPDAELPGLTRVVFGIANALPWLALASAIAIVCFTFLRKNNVAVDREYRKLSSRMALKLPIVKEVVLIYNMHNFASTLGMMIKNGVRLNTALMLTQKVIKNVYIKSEVATASLMMVNGYTLSEALREQTYFDKILVNIILTGEETGEMSFALSEIARFYGQELERRIENLMAMVQPASMILIGLIAAPVIVAIYMPILSLSSGNM